MEAVMRWAEITIKTMPEAVDAACGILYETGVGGVNIEDSSVLEEANRQTREWDVLDIETIEKYTTDTAVLKAYYAPDTDLEEVVLRIREGLNRAAEYFDIGEATIEVAYVQEQDWENNWKQYYKPIEIGRRILVKPQWEEVADTHGRDVILELDPGMAFGTGTHETTKMCLELLEEWVYDGCSLLDIGTGSGILAVAAVKLGAQRCVAVDIDANAVRIAGDNAELNGVRECIDFICGNLAEHVNGRFDVVVANIIADAIIMLSPDIPRIMQDGGVFAASGIIKDRYAEVKVAIEDAGMRVVDERFMGDWVAVLIKN